MNVSEESLRHYITVFHDTLTETAKQFLPTEHHGSLLHTALLPARIIGYVSTQLGAGIEYKPADQTEITIVRGSARVEDLFVQAPARARGLGPLLLFEEGSPGFHDASGAFNLTLSGAFPFRLAGPRASARFGDVCFRIGLWRRKVAYAEIFGNRTHSFWSEAQAVARAKDEVLAALAQLERAELRRISLPVYIQKFKAKTVLLLGDYDPSGIKRLRRLASVLWNCGYDPILLKDVPDLPALDLPQKVATIGSLARFVIVDDSTASGHLAEVQLCRTHNWITVLLREGGKGASWMTAGASATSNVILEQAYDQDAPEEAMDTAIEWAEAKIEELGREFNALFPWRRQD